MRTRGSQVVLCLTLVAAAAGCAVESVEESELSVGSQLQALELNRACTDSPDAIYAQPRNLPRYDPSRRGDIVRCSTGRTVSAAEVGKSLGDAGFAGIAARYPVQIYRITYRTERTGGRADVSSALVLLPGQRLRAAGETPEQTEQIESEASRRGGPPLIVFGHGTVPYGPACAYSKTDPVQASIFGAPDYELRALAAFATQGYPVIMPDYPGFVAGSGSTGYMLSEEEGHAVLDATRAMQKMLRSAPGQVALVGHSQGGHAVLSAQALARSYGLAGQLVGVAAFAPFWAPGRTFATIFSSYYGFDTTYYGPTLAFALEYFYTHAEVYEGRGRGAQLFKPEVRNALAGFVASCNFGEPLPASFGQFSSDFLQPDFYAAMDACGQNPAACSGGLAGTWETRFRADRPRLDAAGAPVVVWSGAGDVVIDPYLTKCGIDRIASDLQSRFKFCGDRGGDHETVIGNQLSWVTRWIEARARGGAEPAACEGESAITPPGGLACLDPPGNQD